MPRRAHGLEPKFGFAQRKCRSMKICRHIPPTESVTDVWRMSTFCVLLTACFLAPIGNEPPNLCPLKGDLRRTSHSRSGEPGCSRSWPRNAGQKNNAAGRPSNARRPRNAGQKNAEPSNAGRPRNARPRHVGPRKAWPRNAGCLGSRLLRFRTCTSSPDRIKKLWKR